MLMYLVNLCLLLLFLLMFLLLLFVEENFFLQSFLTIFSDFLT